MLQLLHDGCLCCINGSLIDSERNVLDTLVGYGSDRTAIQVYCCQGLRKQMSKKSGYLNSSYLQNIVDICCLEKQINRFIALNFLLSFKETHAMLKQHHLAQREGHGVSINSWASCLELAGPLCGSQNCSSKGRQICFAEVIPPLTASSFFLRSYLHCYRVFFFLRSNAPEDDISWLLSLSMAKRTS